MTHTPSTTTLPIEVEHNGVPTNGYPHATPLVQHTTYDTPEQDPFYYGMRTHMTYDENGEPIDQLAVKLQESERKVQQAEHRADEAFHTGKQEQALATAKKLLPILEDEAISQATGLSIEEVRTLRDA